VLAETTQSLPVDKMGVNWFDVVAVLVLIAGFFRGRKNGMSMEVLPLFQWLSVVIVGGLFYPNVGGWLVNMSLLRFPAAYVMGYALLALVIFFVFSLLKRALTPRLEGSSLFGNAEYYLGMSSGVVRFGCVLLFALAFLNVRHFTAEEIKAGDDYQQRWYGARFFPDLHIVQEQVFEKSFTGHSIKKYLGVLLIQSIPPGEGQPEQNPAPVH
jgi:uncharacterized membrane protein required for colicin V production